MFYGSFSHAVLEPGRRVQGGDDGTAAYCVEDGFEYLVPGPVPAEPGLDAHPGHDHQVALEDWFTLDAELTGLGAWQR